MVIIVRRDTELAPPPVIMRPAAVLPDSDATCGQIYKYELHHHFTVHLHTVTHVDQLFRWPHYKLLELEEKTSFNYYLTVTLPLLRPLSSAKIYTLSCSCLLRRSKYEGYKGSRGHFYDFIELLRPIKMIYIQ